ncbi:MULTISPECIES: hypothetical protein [unclassified Streptomyces]|nr:hypothetical protein [Streptomyces sp. NBC_01453]
MAEAAIRPAALDRARVLQLMQTIAAGSPAPGAAGEVTRHG